MLAIVGIALAALGTVSPVRAQSEATMRDWLCRAFDREVRTPAGTSIDCVSPTHAIEIDWTEKWAEAIGQSLHYAEETGLRPGIILICHQTEGSCLAHSLRLQSTLAYWRIPMTIWFCDIGDRRLAVCHLRKITSAERRTLQESAPTP